MKSVFKRALLASLLAGSVFSAFAQGMVGPMGGPPHEGMPAGMHHPDPAKMQEVIAKRLTALKAKLKITPEQEGAWATFAAAMKPSSNMGQRPDPAEMKKLTTPERIDKMRSMRSLRQTEMDQRADAVKAFYVTLTPEQKKVFDAQHMHSGQTNNIHRGKKGTNPPPLQ